MPNSQHCFSCTPMKPCKCKGLPRLFKGRPFSKFFKYLHRRAGRRRSTRRFRSIHAIFWPLMSMRSDERERTAEHPSLTETEAEIETEMVLRPLPVEPTPPNPPTSSYTKTEPTPLPLTSSYTRVEPAPPPLTSYYTKVEPTPPPLTSSYIKIAAQMKKIEEKTTEEVTEVQRACRIFEKYLMEMLMEERKVRDLLDVEELMYCMDKLNSPAFIELVCTFYGELCMDLFSNGDDKPVLEDGGN